jgi:hypothetical protein
VVLTLPPGSVVDVQVVATGTWADAVTLPGLGADLLEGTAVRDAAAFETWLLARQRHAAGASEAILHEAALGSMARGALEEAIGYAVRAAALSPLDENHQALLIRLYRMAGDDDAAAKQFAACSGVLEAELGDPCWEGMAGRGLALVASAAGDIERAFALLADARTRCNRLAEPYLWLDVYILDAQCQLGVRYGHADVGSWVGTMRERASRAGCGSSCFVRCGTGRRWGTRVTRPRRRCSRRRSRAG